MDLDLAFTIHHRKYRNNSAIVELFTQEHGRVTVVARGSQQMKSKMRLAVQAFLPLQVQWRGKGELVTLCSAEQASKSLYLSGSAMLSGLYLNELLLRLLAKYDPHRDLFDAYATALNSLAGLASHQSIEIPLRRFEFKLLRELGFEINFNTDAISGSPIEPELQYCYRSQLGFVKSGGANGLADSSYELSHMIFAGSDLLDIANNNWQHDRVLAAAKRLSRIALLPLLGDKPLQSRSLFISA